MTKEEIRKEVAEKESYNDFATWIESQDAKALAEAWVGHRIDSRTHEGKMLIYWMTSRKGSEKCYGGAETIYDAWEKARDAARRAHLHIVQMPTMADIASVTLFDESGNKVNIGIGGDGEGKVAVLHDRNEIPSYYKSTGVTLSGKWKISEYDCKMKEIGEVEADFIDIYVAGKSVILLAR